MTLKQKLNQLVGLKAAFDKEIISYGTYQALQFAIISDQSYLYTSEVIEKLLKRAREHVEGRPVVMVCNKHSWSDCVLEGFFWFNTEDNSTHVIKI